MLLTQLRIHTLELVTARYIIWKKTEGKISTTVKKNPVILVHKPNFFRLNLDSGGVDNGGNIR